MNISSRFVHDVVRELQKRMPGASQATGASDGPLSAGKHKSETAGLHLRHALNHVAQASRLVGDLAELHADDTAPADSEKALAGATDDLRKAAPKTDGAVALVKAAHAHGRVEVTDKPVAAVAKPGTPEPVPTGAVREVRERIDVLKLARAARVEGTDARLREAQRLADALASPPIRVRYIAMEPQPPAPWSPHLGEATAGAGAALLADADPTEVAAAVAAGDAGWLERIRDRTVAGMVKRIRGVPVGPGHRAG